MNLLRSRPVTHDPDDGMRATYECQFCLLTYEGIFDPYDVPDEIPCVRGCWGDEDEEEME